MRRAFRLASILLVSLFLAALLVSTAWLVAEPRRGRYRARFQRAWARVLCAVLGIHVEVVGDVPPGWSGLAVANHLGYADILVLGSVLPGSFVSKSDVARWPGIGLLASIAGQGTDRKTLAGISRDKVEALGKISDRHGCQLPGDLIWIRSVS